MKVAAFILLFLLVTGGVLAAVLFPLSAIPDPSRFETVVASMGKRWLIPRQARQHTVPEPSGDSSSMGGGMTFNGDCAFCHGQDGRTPSDVGLSMYPRVPSLAGPEVQQWSDQELFWIIRNGIRHTGMGGFGKSLSDSQIWDLVRYVRSLRDTTPAGGKPQAQPSH